MPGAAVNRSSSFLSLSGADDKVKTFRDGFDKDGNVIGVVLRIGVKENKDIWISLSCLCQYALDGCSFASIFILSDYGGAGKFGNPRGVIRASIINNDLVCILLCLGNYASDISCFIIGRYASKDANLLCRVWSLGSKVFHSISTSRLLILRDCGVCQDHALD